MKLDSIPHFTQIHEQIDREISSLIPDATLSPDLNSALKYVLFPGGKRIRPFFALNLCRELGGDDGTILPAALSLELLHTASLIHDDLPAIDNDELRRGKPACHIEFGEATALLLSDFMVPFALEVAGRVELPDSKKLLVLSSLSSAYKDLCIGQYLDLHRDRAELTQIYLLKTGALFKAAAKIAAVGAGLSAEAMARAADFGLAFGECFQLLDDYLDLFGSDEEHGRHGSSDARNHKVTEQNFSEQGRARSLNRLRDAEERALERLNFLEAADSSVPRRSLDQTRLLISCLSSSAKAK